MKLRGLVLCPTCKHNTFRLVVPKEELSITVAFAECTTCGEWMRQFTGADVKPVSPKKETT